LAAASRNSPTASPESPADIVLANLTASVLQRLAANLRRLIAPGGELIASGFSSEELNDVAASFEITSQDVLNEGEWPRRRFWVRVPTNRLN
jgi:Ribosomal protein L11 methylase